MELNVEESFCKGGKHFVGEELLPRRGVDDVSERKGGEKSQNESCYMSSLPRFGYCIAQLLAHN